MSLDHVRRTYEKLGREDPMYAVLTVDRFRGNRWDSDAFFEHGRREIATVMAYIERLGLTPGRQAALDFGCGVGRLTQALAAHFAHVTAVDISHTMIESAQRFDRHPERIRWVVNTAPDLRTLGDARFDLVYSNITLQHVPPGPAESYIGEFIRLLRPRGLAIFQMPNGPRIEPGSLRARWYTLRREYLRRWLKRLRGRAPYEMHFLARSRVEERVAASGGRIVDVVDIGKRKGANLRYCATLQEGTPVP